MISFRPAVEAIRKVVRSAGKDLETLAVERWVIAPRSTEYVKPATYIPSHLERIRGAEFASMDDTIRAFKGGFKTEQGETLGFRLKNVDLVDGVLYAAGATKHLKSNGRWTPAYVKPIEVTRGALYESWMGNRWFGLWLMDDCLTYPLAQQFGSPVTTASPGRGHVPDYESALGMRPRRVRRVHFDELIIFDDSPHNENKRRRGDTIRNRLISNISTTAHPGVFIVRGRTGDLRVLINERAIAERLASKYGFRILTTESSSVEDFVEACAGARVVAGVEGSHLVHGLVAMPPDALLFTIQPPDRAVSWLKINTDRQGQDYAFVVGEGGEGEFRVDVDDVERTLEMALS